MAIIGSVGNICSLLTDTCLMFSGSRRCADGKCRIFEFNHFGLVYNMYCSLKSFNHHSDQQNEIIKLKDKIKDLEQMLIEDPTEGHNGELG